LKIIRRFTPVTRSRSALHFPLAPACPEIYTGFSRDSHPFLTFTLQNGRRWNLSLKSEEGESIV
jgi:hypothetical protein